MYTCIYMYIYIYIYIYIYVYTKYISNTSQNTDNTIITINLKQKPFSRRTAGCCSPAPRSRMRSRTCLIHS